MTIPSAEEVAGDLLRASGQVKPAADLKLILGLLPGVHVSTEPLDNDGYLVDVPGGAEILINSNAGGARQRFTLAHELGHHALNVGLGSPPPQADRAQLERWCDRFAVGLLMPAPWVARFVNAASPQQRAIRVASGPGLFGVSRTAFWLRVTEVTDAWVIEFTLADDVPRIRADKEPELPQEVASLARMCVGRLAHKKFVSVAAYGLRASCARISPPNAVDQRSVVVVSTT